MRAKVILGLESTLQHLLRHGWNGVLTGHYVSAVQLLRLVSEVSDYMTAAALSNKGAQRLWSGQPWELKPALKVIQERLERENSEGAARWSEIRLAYRKDLYAVTHTSLALIKFAVHFLPDQYLVGLAFNRRTALYTTSAYLDACAYATIALATGFIERFPDGEPWSDRQRTTLARVDRWKTRYPREAILANSV